MRHWDMCIVQPLRKCNMLGLWPSSNFTWNLGLEQPKICIGGVTFLSCLYTVQCTVMYSWTRWCSSRNNMFFFLLQTKNTCFVLSWPQRLILFQSSSKWGSVKSCVPMCPKVSQGISVWLIIVWCDRLSLHTDDIVHRGKTGAPVQSPSSDPVHIFAWSICINLHHIVQLRRMGLRVLWQFCPN